MAKLFNRAKMTTATTGVGTVVLGSAASGFQSFADAGVSDGDVVQYVIEDGAQFEIGVGSYSASGLSITRTPSETSDPLNAAISLSGNANISITAVASDFSRLQSDGTTKVQATPSGATVTGDLSVTGTVDGRDIAADGAVLDAITSYSDGDVDTHLNTNTATTDQVLSWSGSDYSWTAVQGVPSGVIVMWAGSVAAVPSGWAICDGLNGTPNLTDRFVIHADADTGGTRNVGATGGSHNTTLTNTQLPSHTHSFSANTSNTGAHTHSADGNLATDGGGSHSHNFNANTGDVGDHTHSGSTSNTGGHSHSGSTSNTGAHTHSIPATYNGGSGRVSAGAANGNVNANTASAGNHKHNFSTNNTGNHSHNFNTNGSGAHSHNFNANTGNVDNHTHDVTGNTSSAGDHSHSVSGTTGATGSGAAFSTIPAFYALAYIMKL